VTEPHPLRDGQIALAHGRTVRVFKDGLIVILSPALRIETSFRVTRTERGQIASLLKSPRESGAPAFKDSYSQDDALSSQDYLRQYADIVSIADEENLVTGEESEGDEDDTARTMLRIASYIDWLEAEVARLGTGKIEGFEGENQT